MVSLVSTTHRKTTVCGCRIGVSDGAGWGASIPLRE
jgi:hypothetical protein